MLDLTDNRYARNLVGMFLAENDTLGRPKESFNVELSEFQDQQYKFRFEYDTPKTRGSAFRDREYSDTEISFRKVQKPQEIRFEVSGYSGAEWVDEFDFNRVVQSPLGFADWINGRANAINESKYRAIMDDLLAYDSSAQDLDNGTRSGNVVPTWATWGYTDTRLMHVAYPLLSGFSGNEATGSGEYQYGENLDMNAVNVVDYTRFKAVSAGSDAVPFGVMDPTNIETKLKTALKRKDKNAINDRHVVFCDSAVRAYIMDYAAQFVSIVNPDKAVKYGYTDILDYCGYWWCYEPYLDDLAAVGGAKRVVLGLNPATWMFRHYKLRNTRTTMGDQLRNNRGIKVQWDWEFRAQFLCKQPWRNFLAYNVEVA